MPFSTALLTVTIVLWIWVAMLSPVIVSQLTFPASNNGGSFTSGSSQLMCSQSGPQGSAGVPGASGPPGTPGSGGPPGEDGPDGRDGDKGAKGHRGASGRSGNQGRPGSKGRKGAIGKTGPSGQSGLRGTPGQTGKQGAKGVMGDEGEPGVPGRCNCGSPPRSAFSVAVTKSSPRDHRPIPFRRILLNEGKHYNASTGKFVCVIPGVYYFSYDITIAGDRHLAIGLVHNGLYKTRTYDTNSGNHDVASGSAILRLKSSDQVWLQIYSSEHNGLFFDPFWTDSIFTGFLIYADQDFLNEADRKANAKDDRLKKSMSFE
ncbi:hypothetical protein WMY93_009754 [Mugilogobius chulae]|uniref:C1q domain-containing protein n=1 Tax=Mugilogobius chulae TaxID=88201 RepID=A0AAW0PNK6_9GOBI